MTNLPQKSARGLVWVSVIAAVIVLIDQITKWIATVNLEGEPTVQVVGDWFRLTFIRNPGAAFSIGTQYTWIFSLAATAVAVVILIASRRVTSKLWLVAMGTLLGGAVGNLIDRFSQPPGAGQGHVVDFIEMPFLPIVGGTVFNVADMAVVGAAIMMIVLSVFGVDPTGDGVGQADDSDADDQSASSDGAARSPDTASLPGEDAQSDSSEGTAS